MGKSKQRTTTSEKFDTRAGSVSEGRHGAEFSLLPSCLSPSVITALTLTFRVYYVIQPQNWWMVHPDEVYQSIEVAHIESYGYGFRTYEFSPPQLANNVTKYRQMELQEDMYGLRSPIFPYFYVIAEWLISKCIVASPYLLWRVCHVCVTSMLPLAVARYATSLTTWPDVPVLSALLVAVSVHLNVFGTHCLLHSFLAPFTFLGLSLLMATSHEATDRQHPGGEPGGNGTKDVDLKLVTNRGAYKHFVSRFSIGCLIGITCYVRPDTVSVYGLHVVLCSTVRRLLQTAGWVPVCVGVLFSASLGALVDFGYYGWGVISPINWFRFNVVKDLSTKIFGKMSSFMYFTDVFLNDPGIALLSAIVAIVQICLYLRQEDKPGETKVFKKLGSNFHSNEKNSTCLTLGLTSTLFIMYSLKGHKEVRFVHDAIVLFYIHAALVLVALRSTFSSWTSSHVIRAILAVFVLIQWQVFPSAVNNKRWVYLGAEGVHDVNACIEFISRQTDVKGVFYDSNIFMTGGMTLLHHDVTILTLVTGGFYEFGPTSRVNVTTRSVNEMTQASNYVALSNAPAVARVIIENSNYNYLVLRGDRQFLGAGFHQVFTAGTRRVLKRSSGAESQLQEMLGRIPLGTNTTVLTHEGDFLFHMSQYREASRRFQHVLALDKYRLEAYLPLTICYINMGEEDKAEQTQVACQALFSKSACTTARKITRV
ncbi:uncharacterized protein LOC131952845 [Physella acuta]|uniref:uncharacterized protein LOC131952845 n=1 Tax=Physella acuta TaxID=109671 RepID=UPI0027DD506F|nr:uncharacterized protein LOC131952845 [Physella acuta]